jgi:murein DD-endopeptidase MepM/ murein hydrolase activator NlpD
MTARDRALRRIVPLALLLSGLLLAAAPPAARAQPPAGAQPAQAALPAQPEGTWPLDPVPAVHAGFEPPGQPWDRGHRGVDLRGRAGQPVRAALPGRIGYVGRIAGVSVVVVDHGATRTTYQPVRATVRVGEHVTAGATIGHLEWFGSHCMPAACLHWGWIEGRRYLDPLALVRGPRPVRLLPDQAPGGGLRPGGEPAGRPFGAGPW